MRPHRNPTDTDECWKETVKSPLPKQISQKLRGFATWMGNDTSPVYEAAELDEIEAEMEKEWRELYQSGAD
jgi:hypothetical protein